MNKNKLALLLLVAGLVGVFFALDLGHYFSLDYVKGAQAGFAQLYAQHPVAVALAFTAVYVAVTALSLPGATILTLVAGAVFGLWAYGFAALCGLTVVTRLLTGWRALRGG